jgi:hypothetical protein
MRNIIICFLFCVFAVTGCGAVNKDEVARLTAPSGQIDAVLLETNGGATTSFGYEVHMVKTGAKPVDSPMVVLYGALRNDNAYGVNLRWESDSVLAVEYLTAKSTSLMSSRASVEGHAVNLVLRPGVADPAAPAGGMFYNLQGRR